MKTPIRFALILILAAITPFSTFANPQPDRRPGAVRSNRAPLARTPTTPMRTAPTYHRGGYYGGRHRGYYGYPWRYPYMYGHYGWPYYWGPTYYRYERHDTGAVDLNVKPRSTRVFLNGYLIGKTDRFDGFPSHLYLPQGDYELIFYKKGYETVRKGIRIVAGTTLRANFQMEKGQATPVDEVTQVTFNPENVRESLYNRYSKDRPSAQESVRQETLATTILHVGPADAVIYLDNEFLGTTKVLQRHGGQLYLKPGKHVIEVSRPGFKTERIEFEAVLGKVEEFTVTLEAEN